MFPYRSKQKGMQKKNGKGLKRKYNLLGCRSARKRKRNQRKASKENAREGRDPEKGVKGQIGAKG